MRRFFANLFFLIIVAAVVFYIGWIQFSIKPGTCGVMVSKTSGVLKDPVLPGRFVWRWEKLLPTNATLIVFSMDPYKSEQEYSGSLPSNVIYEKLLNNNVDFSYDIKMSISLSMLPEEIVKHVANNEIKNQEDLNKFLENKAMVMAKEIAEYLLNAAKDKVITHPKALDKETLDYIVSRSLDFNSIVLNSVEFESVNIPDFEMYENAKNLYDINKLYDIYKADNQEAIKEKQLLNVSGNQESEREITINKEPESNLDNTDNNILGEANEQQQ